MSMCTFWLISLSTWNVPIILCRFSKTLSKQFLSMNLRELYSFLLHSKSFLKVLENWQSVIGTIHVDRLMKLDCYLIHWQAFSLKIVLQLLYFPLRYFTKYSTSWCNYHATYLLNFQDECLAKHNWLLYNEEVFELQLFREAIFSSNIQYN